MLRCHQAHPEDAGVEIEVLLAGPQIALCVEAVDGMQ
jgi:hypothetical protein